MINATEYWNKNTIEAELEEAGEIITAEDDHSLQSVINDLVNKGGN